MMNLDAFKDLVQEHEAGMQHNMEGCGGGIQKGAIEKASQKASGHGHCVAGCQTKCQHGEHARNIAHDCQWLHGPNVELE